jgi:N-acetyl sugar amidotransferase
MLNSGIEICKRCVMDSTDREIRFNAAGICDHCITFEKEILPNWQQGGVKDKQLSSFAKKVKARAKSRDFDCLIGMSGGVDSSYLLHLAVVQLGLRPLVFHVDAGWNSQEAVNNIQRMIDKLDLDLYTEVINWEEMKDLQLAFFKSGVPHIDTPQDHAFFATMYKFAAENGIKDILTGGNYSTECIRNPIEWMYYQTDSIQLKAIHNRFGNLKLSTFPVSNILWHKVWLPYIRGIRVSRPLDMMKYNKEQATSFLEQEYGYQRYPQKHFESRFTRFYEGFWLPARFGFDTRKVQLSSLILTGQISRDAALEILSQPAMTDEQVKREFEYVAAKLDIGEEELQSYLEMPKYSFRDYPSQHGIYSWGAWVLKGLGIEKGGKR